MLRTLAIALAVAASASAASAQPPNLSEAQMDYVTAGADVPFPEVLVTTAALTAVPFGVPLPQPLSTPLPLPQAAGFIVVNATTHPATVIHSH